MIILTKGDKLLIVLILLISILSFAYINRYAFSDKEKYISVQVNGVEIKKILFDTQLVGHTIPVKSEYGYNLIELGDGKVRVIEADCPDKIDVKQGYISRIGETIVCLPNRMVIEIKGVTSDDQIDVMNY
ncbi:MAG: NusG domain II-containing protein [Gudongella sp.]|jgi:hypothetical protein|nr:NusG domain II-containing protein [Gudongella sp.]